MKTLKTYYSSIPSDINCVGNAVEEVLGYIQELCTTVQECTLFELKVVLNELILNAIRHGNKGQITKNVSITTGIAKADQVFIIVADEGEGYDYKCIVERNSNIEEMLDICDMKETGRGIFLVKNLCDKIKYNNKGNKIIVLKKIYK